ncbi:MAG: 2OG-Fe(II) oxygenase [Minwuia sp.]|uniref:2OG-Fe(II) oxygenase n=1 Tax=Minwuia sp. TaxID=2493630 RepID=UPI003A8A5B4A
MKAVCPGIWYFDELLSLNECDHILSEVGQSENWQKSEAGRYHNNSLMEAEPASYKEDIFISRSYSLEDFGILNKFQSMLSSIAENTGIRNLFWSNCAISKYESGAILPKHKDSNMYDTRRIFTAVVFLNDNFDGGELRFEGLDAPFVPRVGGVVVFISENFHSVEMVREGTRYSLVVFAEHSR